MLIDFIPRTFIAFCVLFIFTRLLGKKQMGQLTYFNYITGITFGAVTAQIAVDKNLPILGGVIALIFWMLLAAIVEYAGFKWKSVRKLINGEPVIVINKGAIVQQALSSLRLNLEDLLAMLRVNSVFSIQDVDFAVFETNGQLSIWKKEEKLTTSKADLKILPNPRVNFPSAIIIKGDLVKDNPFKNCIDKTWLENELKKQGGSIKDTYFAQIESDGNLFIQKENS